MGDRWVLFFCVIITSYIQVSHGCLIDGIPNWLLPQNIRIRDTDSGIVYKKSTTGIEGINSVTHRKEGLNGGPYVIVSLVDSELTISTHDNYKTYEDIETAQSIGFTANFRCADGSSRNLVFSIDIIDTNNNDPVFKPSNSYELTLAPPVPPNFLLTNCISDIIVRDIDLTTERIDFALEGSELFEIAYDNSSTIPKEFKATLRTTTFIRSIPEAIILTITATDVDRTGDPRRTSTATVKVLADSQFELPDEPIFSQPFYIANYTKEHEFILQDSIYLRQGYDSEVKFSLDGQLSENFKLIDNGNQITFTVTTPLPEESFQQREIYLTVIAQREYTSGANAMIVLHLPEARELSFEKPLYSGKLEGHIVAHETIILNIGDYSEVTFNLKGQYEEYFTVKSTQNTILIELQKDVSENIIKENNFISLNLVASGINAITTSTAIFLEIIKPDYETPVFSQKIYNGLYSNNSKVNFQDISLLQGYDETVMFDLVGDHAKYFSMETTTNNIVLALNSTIPEDLIFNEKVLLFNIVAEKPRTVGANTAVALKFPEELTEPTILKFTKNTYNGVLKDGKLTVEDIILKSGFTSQTKFTLNGDFNQDFTISNTNNVVTIAISNSESLEEIEKNKFVVLEIEATGERAVAVTTIVIIDIPEIVIVYPVFEKSFYRGYYTKDGGLEFTEEISLRQGYDSSVKFSLEGESSQWFSLIQNEKLVKLISNETNPLPDDLIDKYSHLLFTIVADKLGTIGGRAAIHIDLPKETEDPIVLQFEKREYIGRIENESLHLDEIRLLNVRAFPVALNLTGEFASYFRIKEQSDSVTIELLDIPKELLENNNFFVLNMEASHPNAIKGHTTVILDIVRSQESQLSPIFEQAYYVGEYSNREGFIFSDKIKLSQGFDETVSFELEGDSSKWFDLLQIEENSFTLSVKNDNLNEVTNQFPLIFTVVAHKTSSKSARATIIITFKGSEIEAKFSKVLYNGILEDGVVSHEPITVSGYDGTDIQIIGDYESSFEVNFSNSVVTIRKAPSAVFPVGLTHVALTLRAGRANAVLLLDVTDSGSEIEATFSKVLYNGRLEDGVVSHETITMTGYKGTTVQIIGAYESSFEVSFSNGIVTIRRAASAVFPVGLTHIALTLQAGRASAVLLLDITHSGSESEATFNKVLYNGRIENGVVSHDTITIAGFDGTTIQIIGAYGSSFEVELTNGIVTIRKAASAVFPVGLTHIALTLQAGRASAVLLLDVADSGSEIEATFSKALYSGKLENGVATHETITIFGYDGTSVQIIGEHESLFEVNLLNGVVTIRKAASAVIPVGLTHIALTIQAGRANAVLLLDITDTESQIEATFSKVLYNGKLENSVVSHETITITGYEGTSVQIIGTYETSFEVEFANGVVTIRKAASAVFPVELTYIALTLQAGHASAVLLLDVTDSGSEIEVAFSKILYNGNLENGVLSHETITITGYHGTSVQIIGAYESVFEVNLTNGVVTIRKAASAVLPVGVTHIALTLQAGRASAVLLLDVTNNGSEIDVTFSKVLYNGNLKNGVLSHETITVFGYDGTSVQIVGAYESSFEVNFSNGIVTVRKAASAVFPVELRHIALTLQAGRASAVLLLDVTDSGSEIEAAFSKILYNGNLENGVLSHETITITGYHGTSIQIIGAYESLFEVNLTNGIVTIRKAASAVLPVGVTHIALTLQAGRASAVLLLDVTNNGSEIGVTFSKVLYNGNLKNGVLSHETITVFGYDGTSIQIVGAYESSFEVNFSNGIVTVSKAASAVFPVELTHITLTLQADRASAVLLIDVTNSGDTDLPAVTFSRTSYFLWADINQSGVVGKVQATAENGERILYSIQVDDDNNIRERISINNEGEILLSAAVQSGIYSFIVTATAENSRVNATASVLLRVEALRDCSSDVGLPPLIVLEKPEEEPHKNLVILNQTEYKDCRYNILNSWPADQSWLYVDEEGLHAKAIDREHESIAFMTLSQIQVELILQCDSDEVSVAKRSLNTERLQLGPDEYGSNKWILADTIVYDARRSFVNLIVNDINDNKPIFIGNENDTIYVGFPVTELEDIILPRALTELKATDADIGENAALIYWSTEDNLAVAPKTGFVHVRNTARLENNSRLTVYATDLNGKGLTGTLDIVVKLLDTNQIAVITVRNAFLDDEDSVLNDLSEAIGYEIKVLRTVVISENNEDSSRKRRDVESSSGASLQLYVYGLQESEPVDVLRLTSDINNSDVVSVNVARVLSLEDHLEGLEICTILGRDTVLFVTTIVLAVLLLIVIVVIFVWFILIKKFQIHLKWRKKQNYDQFNDTNSLESRNSAMEPIPKVEIQSKPRINIEELKRSERRLQEMLDTPIQEIQPIEPVNAVNDVTNEPQVETILDIPNPISPLPIVIQSIDKLKTDNDGSDDEDEFGEEKKEKPRKPVVTFNENVEKIIHLEDNYEDRSEPDLEVYKF